MDRFLFKVAKNLIVAYSGIVTPKPMAPHVMYWPEKPRLTFYKVKTSHLLPGTSNKLIDL